MNSEVKTMTLERFVHWAMLNGISVRFSPAPGAVDFTGKLVWHVDLQVFESSGEKLSKCQGFLVIHERLDDFMMELQYKLPSIYAGLTMKESK